jgi:DNA integrity scanning protein DisA with diadenylate cyclase activity
LIDEHKLLRDSGRSAEAQSLLDNALFNEALATLEVEYIKAWKATPLRDSDGRERVWQAVQIVGKIKDHISSVLNDGKLAAAQLKELADDRDRKGPFIGLRR